MGREDSLRKIVLETLDQPILVLSDDLRRVMLRNRAASRLVPGPLPSPLSQAVADYVEARRAQGRPPPNQRTVVGERAFYLRVLAGVADPPVEIVLLAEEVLREVDAFKLLHTRNGVSRREYRC